MWILGKAGSMRTWGSQSANSKLQLIFSCSLAPTKLEQPQSISGAGKRAVGKQKFSLWLCQENETYVN